MELLNKSVIKFNCIDSKLIFDLDITTSLPDCILEKKIFEKLNKYKNSINNVTNIRLWDFCKKLSNPYEIIHVNFKGKNSNCGIGNYDPISRSFFKMWEILNDFNLVDNNKKMGYAALAEGPGGFIECFNFYRRKNSNFHYEDKLFCITLKPYNKDIPGWKKSQKVFRESCNYHISYGKDDTGNLYNVENIRFFSEEIGKDKVDLVTADGGFDFSYDYSNQETSAFQLIFCEIVTGLTVLNKNGNMVIKIFDIFNSATIDLIYILCHYFENIYITKPFTSRPANSEKYFVCKNFKGISEIDLNKLHSLVEEINIISEQKKNVNRLLENEIPEEFINILNSANIHFISSQINSLIKAITYVKNKIDNEDINNIRKNQTIFSTAWCKKYHFPINIRSKFLNENNNYNYIPTY